MNNYLRGAVFVLAVIFLVIGFIGLFLPILQGVLFIIIGLYLLSLASLRFKNKLDKWLIPFPRVKTYYDRQFEAVDRFWKKMKRK